MSRTAGHDDESQDFSFYTTVINSPQWKKWGEFTREILDYDISLCEEEGIITPTHFQQFLQFVKGADL